MGKRSDTVKAALFVVLALGCIALGFLTDIWWHGIKARLVDYLGW